MNRTRFGRITALAAAGLLVSAATSRAQVTVTKKEAPDRNGAAAGKGDNTSCPPGPDATSKSKPNAALGDKDVDGDKTLDFYMGEYHFVKGNQDVKVRLWCINRKEKANSYADFFSTEVLTSNAGVDTVQVKPGHPD